MSVGVLARYGKQDSLTRYALYGSRMERAVQLLCSRDKMTRGISEGDSIAWVLLRGTARRMSR